MERHFTSHSSLDDAFVRELRWTLADLKPEVWIDSRELRAARRFSVHLDAAFCVPETGAATAAFFLATQWSPSCIHTGTPKSIKSREETIPHPVRSKPRTTRGITCMSEQLNNIAITTVASTPIAIETTPGLAAFAKGSSDFELIGAKPLPEHVGELTALIKNTATALVESINSIEQAVRPKKIEAEFSVGFSIEAGFWYVAKGSATGAIKVKLEWEPTAL
jgi:hypothetical protein